MYNKIRVIKDRKVKIMDDYNILNTVLYYTGVLVYFLLIISMIIYFILCVIRQIKNKIKEINKIEKERLEKVDLEKEKLREELRIAKEDRDRILKLRYTNLYNELNKNKEVFLGTLEVPVMYGSTKVHNISAYIYPVSPNHIIIDFPDRTGTYPIYVQKRIDNDLEYFIKKCFDYSVGYY